MDQIKFGKFISSLRTEKHLTQEQLAKKLNVSSKTVSKWECGNLIPDFETLILISKELNVSLYELSECQRVTRKRTGNILKTINKNQLKEISFKKRIAFIFIIMVAVISLMSIIYTITNFNTTKVYTLESLNEDFKVYGAYTKTKDYSVFSITRVDYIGNDYKLEETPIYNYSYEVFSQDKHIYSYTPNDLDNNDIIIEELFAKINILIDSKTYNTNTLNNTNDLLLTISYRQYPKIKVTI